MQTASRMLFLIVAVLWTLVGVLTPPLMDKRIGPPQIFISERTDTALFGAPPLDVLTSNLQLATVRAMIIKSLAGLLVAAGLLTAGLAWFGLAEPKPWALATLTVVGVAVLPYWWITLAPYRAAGISLGLGDLPPFMWVPAILMPIASALGWISYIQS